MSAELSRLLWDAREMLDMAADGMERERGVGPYRDLIIQIDAYRRARGWSPHGFGGEDDVPKPFDRGGAWPSGPVRITLDADECILRLDDHPLAQLICRRADEAHLRATHPDQ